MSDGNEWGVVVKSSSSKVEGEKEGLARGLARRRRQQEVQKHDPDRGTGTA